MCQIPFDDGFQTVGMYIMWQIKAVN